MALHPFVLWLWPSKYHTESGHMQTAERDSPSERHLPDLSQNVVHLMKNEFEQGSLFECYMFFYFYGAANLLEDSMHI